MRIQTNVESLNAYRNLSETNRQQSTHMERLSSGFRINRAADDAAGLAISEQMRGQIGGLDQATENAQDATSLIQTAEGALNESHEILQRMRELSVQSANDTLTESDRAEIQEEVNELAEELTRIGETTEFNTQELLDGQFEENIFHIGANEGQNIEMDISDMRANELEVVATEITEWEEMHDGEGTVENDGLEALALHEDTTLEITDDENEEGVHEIDVDDQTITVTIGDDPAPTQEEFVDAINEHDEASELIELDTTDADAEVETMDEIDFAFPADNVELEPGDFTYEADDTDSPEVGGVLLDGDGEVVAETDDGEEFTDADDNVVFEAGDALQDGEEFSVGGIQVDTQESADAAISTIDDAIETVSSERSELGAVQNRLDHTVSNLEVASENLQAAESRIRDTDMAAEMTEFTTTQILEEAGTAMLAQANQAPQNVLQLLG